MNTATKTAKKARGNGRKTRTFAPRPTISLEQALKQAKGHDGVKLCLYPICEREPGTRGLCSSHYSQMARLVSASESKKDNDPEKVTWESLEKRGRVLALPQVQPISFNQWALHSGK